MRDSTSASPRSVKASSKQPRKPLTGAYKPSSTPAAASFAAADGGVASSWALTLVSAAAFGVFALSLYSKADGAEARPLLVKAT